MSGIALSTLILGVALAVFVGVALGLLGGGGSILTVPILVYVLGLPAHQAIAMSLLVVGTTSVAALVPHARGKRVRWSMGLLFGAASMVGAYGAGRIAKLIPAAALLLLFGGMMLVTAIAMMRKGKGEAESTTPTPPAKLPYAMIALEGLVVGAFTGLVGAGGGFLVVPALVLLGKLPMREAVGTSLLVIAMKSFAGFAGYLATTHVDWALAAVVTTAAVSGSFVGASFAGKVRQDLLRQGFAWFVVVMAVFILGQEIPKALGWDFSLARHWPMLLAAVSVPIALGVASLIRAARHGNRTPGPGVPGAGVPGAAARL